MKTRDLHSLRLCEVIRPADRVAWGQSAAEPVALTRALVAQRHTFGGRIRVFLGTSWTDTVRPEHADAIDFQAWGGGGTNRALAQEGLLDVFCCHYSDLAFALGPDGPNQVDVLLLQVAPKNAQGFYSLSVAHEYLVPLLDSARLVIAEVNAAAPWTYGGRLVRDEDLDLVVHTDRPLPLPPATAPSATDLAVARQIAALVDDGVTLQLGVGSVPDAVLRQLGDRRDLGVHSGALTDGLVDLLEAGVITNARKPVDTGVTVGGVLMGGSRLMAHAHQNPRVQLRETTYTHAASTLSQQHRLCAINGAVEVDLTGQVNAEVAAGRYVGAVGGALDFMRGARLSRGGASVIGLPARAGTRSRIVARLSGPVSTPRSDVQYVATEFGIADLRGATLAQRVARMLAISHPDDRATLAAEFDAAMQSARRA